MKRLLVVYHPDFFRLGYPPLKDRVEPIYRGLEERGYLRRSGVDVLEPGPVKAELLAPVHTSRHLSDVEGSGYLEVSLLSTGGVVEAARLVAGDEYEGAFCIVGAAGHHASREGYWGFCFINDVGVAGTTMLEEGLVRKVAIIDIDPHFGDGTRDIFGPESRVLHLNFHSDFGSRGGREGVTNVDISLPYDADDELFMAHAVGAMDRALEFGPDLLFIVFGYDSHRDDYGSFRLTGDAFRRFAVELKSRFPRRVCYVLSGGSGVENGRDAVGSVVDVLSSGGSSP